jgi:hypothetical protein
MEIEPWKLAFLILYQSNDEFGYIRGNVGVTGSQLTVTESGMVSRSGTGGWRILPCRGLTASLGFVTKSVELHVGL